jgi:hypothetical protein
MNALYETRLATAPVTAEAVAEEPKGLVRNIALFVAGPFIALAYVIAFPIVGLCLLLGMAVMAAAKHPAVRTAGRIAKHIALFLAAPWIALAYVVLFPFLGIAALAWVGAKAVVGRHEGPGYRETKLAA